MITENFMKAALVECARQGLNSTVAQTRYGEEFMETVRRAKRSQEFGGLMETEELSSRDQRERRVLVMEWIKHNPKERLVRDIEKYAKEAYLDNPNPIGAALYDWNGTTKDSAPKVQGVTLSNEGFFTAREKVARKIGRACKIALKGAGQKVPCYVQKAEVVVEVEPTAQPTVQSTAQPTAQFTEIQKFKDSISNLLGLMDSGYMEQERVLEIIRKMVN